MSIEPQQLFISSAIDYYVAGRFAVFAGLTPTAGNLLHHAVEMSLKAALSKRDWSLGDLKKLGHRLEDIWQEFKALHPANPNGLKEFDPVIAGLDRFEEIRYPDRTVKQGMLCEIGRGPRPVAAMGLQPTYALYLGEIDRLVGKVFELASVNFQAFTPVMPPARKYLHEENAELAGS
jgi:hypothetical protein